MVLGKVVEYFHYWYRFQNDQDVPDMEIPTELCLEILMAADYLGMHSVFPCFPRAARLLVVTMLTAEQRYSENGPALCPGIL